MRSYEETKAYTKLYSTKRLTLFTVGHRKGDKAE
jgi:hypothetical protein